VRALFLSPWFAIGLALTVLGAGNLYTGVDKTDEYERLLRQHRKVAVVDTYSDFEQLTEATNAAVLRPLQRTGGSFTMVTGKLDFYRLVRTGGEMMLMAGLFLAAVGAIHAAYRHGLGSHA